MAVEMAGKSMSEIGVHLGSRMCKLFPDVVKTKASFWWLPNRIPMDAQGGPKNQLKVGSTWVSQEVSKRLVSGL